MENLKRNLKWYVLGALFAICASVWYVVLAEDRGNILKVAVLDIGQGDSIFIESPSGHKMLVDAGPPGALLPALAKVMPFYDHKIDAIVITSPDQNHFGGFMDIINSYDIGAVLEQGTSQSKIHAKFESLISEKGIKKSDAASGMSVDLGAGVRIDIPASGDGKLFYGDVSIPLNGAVLRSGRPGTVILYSDGKKIWVE